MAISQTIDLKASMVLSLKERLRAAVLAVVWLLRLRAETWYTKWRRIARVPVDQLSPELRQRLVQRLYELQACRPAAARCELNDGVELGFEDLQRVGRDIFRGYI